MKKYRVCTEVGPNRRINYFIQKRILWIFWSRVVVVGYRKDAQPNFSDREQAAKIVDGLNKPYG